MSLCVRFTVLALCAVLTHAEAASTIPKRLQKISTLSTCAVRGNFLEEVHSGADETSVVSWRFQSTDSGCSITLGQSFLVHIPGAMYSSLISEVVYPNTVPLKPSIGSNFNLTLISTERGLEVTSWESGFERQ